MSESSEKTNGQVAFEAYVAERGGKNHDGSDTPPWDALGDEVRGGWEAAARAVAAKVGREMLREMAKDAEPGEIV